MTQHHDKTRPRFTTCFLTGGLAFFAVVLLLLALPDAALAGDQIFGTSSPLTKFVDFVTGPFAYMVVIVALVATVGVLALGGEFSGFSRRMPIIVVAGGIVILAQTVLGNLFGSSRAASLPPGMELHRMLEIPAQGDIPEADGSAQDVPTPDAEGSGALQ